MENYRKTARVQNPVIWADVPDMDVIRVDETFYMVSTSMHSMPGCPIMKSMDLAHWEIVNYVFDTFEDCPGHNLEDGKGIYGQGSWAASLKVYDGVYYVAFNCNDTHHFYIYSTEDIEHGTWVRRAKVEGSLHDPALFFEEDGTPYVIYGCGDIRIVEFEKDLSGIRPGGVDQPLLCTPKENMGLRCEGGHAYKINGMYYLIYIEWPSDGYKRRREVCYRSKSLLGLYERKIIFDDDMGYLGQGIAQGGIFDTKAGVWYAMLFQDHHAVGRIPYILPVTWEDGWPMVGEDGKAVETLEVLLNVSSDVSEAYDVSTPDREGTCTGKSATEDVGMKDADEDEIAPLVISDSFDHTENRLALQWQWNHNPDNSLWSFTERSRYLRLHTGRFVEKGLVQARNTLTQRTEGPSCEAVVRLETAGLKVGDCAGLTALQGQFGTIGVCRKTDGSLCVRMCVNGGDYVEKAVFEKEWEQDVIYLKIHFDFMRKDSGTAADTLNESVGSQKRSLSEQPECIRKDMDKAWFYYSADGVTWEQAGDGLHMVYALDHFMGCRIGLYCYATQQTGGYADFSDFRYRHFEITGVESSENNKKYLLYYYTREVQDEAIYAAKLADSMHLALQEGDGPIIPLNHNSGILYVKATLNEDGTLRAKSLKNLRLFRRKEGGFGVVAERMEADGSEDSEAAGKLLYFTSEDLIHYTEEPMIVIEEDMEADNAGTKWNGCKPEGALLCGTLELDAQEAMRLKTRFLTPFHVANEVPGHVEIRSGEDLEKVKATARYSDGSTAEKMVDWDLTSVDFSIPGEYKVKGRIHQDRFVFPIAENRADPCIVRWNGMYYFIATNDADGNHSLSVRKAAVLSGLVSAPEEVILDSHMYAHMGNLLWAPEFHIIKGKLYIFLAGTPQHFEDEKCHVMALKEHGDPAKASGWEMPVPVTGKDGSALYTDGITLDMTEFEVDGAYYVCWSQRQFVPVDQGAWLYIAQIDPDRLWPLMSDPVLLIRPQYGWDYNHGPVNEGPFALIYEDRIYLTYSAASVDSTYVVGLLTAQKGTDLLKPGNWLKENYPLLSSRSAEGEYGPGHNSYVTDEAGLVWNIYHARPGVNGPRSTGFRRVHFNVEGFPVLDQTEAQDLDPEMAEIEMRVTLLP